MILNIVLDYSKYIFQKESSLLIAGYQRNKKSNLFDYSNQYGSNLLSECIVKSINNSIDKYYINTCSANAINKAYSRLKKLENEINQFKELYKNNFVINNNEKLINTSVYEFLSTQCGNSVYIGDMIKIIDIDYNVVMTTILSINNDVNSKLFVKFINSSKILVNDAVTDNMILPISAEILDGVEKYLNMIRFILTESSSNLSVEKEVIAAIEILKNNTEDDEYESKEKLQGFFNKLRQYAGNLSEEGVKAAVQTLIKNVINLLM